MKLTPGVYIVEKDAFPNSVAEVATAIPVFIGYTEKADDQGKSLLNEPRRIDGPAEYRQHFGAAPTAAFRIQKKADSAEPAVFSQGGQDYVLREESARYLLYHSLELFFANGGGPCYVVSVGGYREDIDPEKLIGGLAPLAQEQEPALVVIPDAMSLPTPEDCAAVQRATLEHCNTTKNRMAILDIHGGHKPRNDPAGDVIEKFRSGIGTDGLGYGAAYYPWLETNVVGSREVGPENIADQDLLSSLVAEELNLPLTEISASLMQGRSRLFAALITEIRKRLNLLPPSGAMAGIYAQVDQSHEVWKAPANVALFMVVAPCIQITNDGQEDLNVPLDGKAVNAIRTFVGQGTLVWGARTLDGNSADWRYINTRRTAIMLEESIRLACQAYVFEPNAVSTWASIKSMIGNFLIGIWKRGGLAGASPEHAFSVRVGLGETMTPEDILEGFLRVTVLVAIVRPAEFIEISFVQRMEKS